MAAKRKKELSMRKVREILRLSLQCNRGNLEIARSCCISHTVVNRYLKRFKEAGLSDYLQIEKISDGELASLLKSGNLFISTEARPQPDWNYVHLELRKKGVTLQLLWEEYKAI